MILTLCIIAIILSWNYGAAYGKRKANESLRKEWKHLIQKRDQFFQVMDEYKPKKKR